MGNPFATEAFLGFSGGGAPSACLSSGIASGKYFGPMPYRILKKDNPVLKSGAYSLVTPICLSGPAEFDETLAVVELLDSIPGLAGGFIQTRAPSWPEIPRLATHGSCLVHVDSRTNYRIPAGLDDQQWLGLMKRDSRARVRQILEREGEFSIEQVEPDDHAGINAFAVMYSEMAERLQFPQTYRFSAHEWKQLLGDPAWTLLLLGYQGHWVAGAVLGTLDGGADYTFMASLPGGQDLSRAMIFHAYRFVQQTSSGFLDLGGGISEGDSLASFKQGMGGEICPFKRVKFLDLRHSTVAEAQCREALTGRWP